MQFHKLLSVNLGTSTAEMQGESLLVLNLHLTSLFLLSMKNVFSTCLWHLNRVMKVFRKGKRGQCLSLGSAFNVWSAAVCGFPSPSVGWCFPVALAYTAGKQTNKRKLMEFCRKHLRHIPHSGK